MDRLEARLDEIARKLGHVQAAKQFSLPAVAPAKFVPPPPPPLLATPLVAPASYSTSLFKGLMMLGLLAGLFLLVRFYLQRRAALAKKAADTLNLSHPTTGTNAPIKSYEALMQMRRNISEEVANVSQTSLSTSSDSEETKIEEIFEDPANAISTKFNSDVVIQELAKGTVQESVTVPLKKAKIAKKKKAAAKEADDVE